MHLTPNFLKATWPTLIMGHIHTITHTKISHYTHLLALPTLLNLFWQDLNKSRRGRQLICNGPLACWLNHSRERLHKTGAVFVTVLSCVIWTRQYWFAQEQGSQHDNFIVVSLTTLQAIQWCQAFCCDGCGAVHKTNTQSKVNGLYCDKTNYTMYRWPSLTSETQTFIQQLNHTKFTKVTYSPVYALLTFSFTHSSTRSFTPTHLHGHFW